MSNEIFDDINPSVFFDEYEFMYRFLWYWNIDSNFIIIWIEEAPFYPDNIYIELLKRKSKSKQWYYSNELLEFFKGEKISTNYYWQIPKNIFWKIIWKNINESEIFYWEYNPFPKSKSSVSLDNFYLIEWLNDDFKNDTNLRFENRKSKISDIIIKKNEGQKKIILISLYENQIIKLLQNEKPHREYYFENNQENIEYCNRLKWKTEKNIFEYHNNEWFYVYKLDSWNIIASIPHLQSIEKYPKIIDSLIDKIKLIF